MPDMSYYEAIQDGVPCVEHKNYFTEYFPPCRFCGTPVRTWTYIREYTYACPECRQMAVAQKRAEMEAGDLTKKEKRLKKAIKLISRVADISKYEDAIAKVKANLDQNGWYQSTEEVMVALELTRRNVAFRHQVKLFNFRMDFVLPAYKVVLEIDGAPFHGKENAVRQNKRDEVILWKMGRGWQVIHIKTDNIDKNVTRLMKAIRAVLKMRGCCPDLLP